MELETYSMSIVEVNRSGTDACMSLEFHFRPVFQTRDRYVSNERRVLYERWSLSVIIQYILGKNKSEYAMEPTRNEFEFDY